MMCSLLQTSQYASTDQEETHCAGHVKPLLIANHHQRGVGLIEILLAVVLLSIGFLAAARMQVAGMRYSQSAYALSQAKFMTTEMTERMRANRAGLDSGAYDAMVTLGSTSEPLCLTAGTSCSAADIALADLHAWSRYLYAADNDAEFVALLPSSSAIAAQGSVTFDAAAQVWNVTVRWSEYIDGSDQQREVALQVVR
ncbi:MAG: type IV pilus modification protein PilV [Granulosicoccus sp.]